MHRLLSLVLMCSATVSCSSTFVHEESLSLSEPLDPSKGILVATPEDGRYETIHYRESGNMTASAVRDTFLAYTEEVEIAAAGDPAATAERVESRYGYLVVPLVLHWEDRNTEWSGRPDRIEIRLQVIEVSTREEISSSSFTGQSKWATFGGDHPQDMLRLALEQIVAGLYGQASPVRAHTKN